MVAAMTGFGFACLTFLVSVVVLVPLTGAAAERFGFPELLTVMLVMFEIFGLTVIGGICGVSLAARRGQR